MLLHCYVIIYAYLCPTTYPTYLTYQYIKNVFSGKNILKLLFEFRLKNASTRVDPKTVFSVLEHGYPGLPVLLCAASWIMIF